MDARATVYASRDECINTKVIIRDAPPLKIDILWNRVQHVIELRSELFLRPVRFTPDDDACFFLNGPNLRVRKQTQKRRHHESGETGVHEGNAGIRLQLQSG